MFDKKDVVRRDEITQTENEGLKQDNVYKSDSSYVGKLNEVFIGSQMETPNRRYSVASFLKKSF